MDTTSLDIAKILGILDADILKYPIQHLSIDSRQVENPIKTIFFALKTESGDGHAYINELYKKGIRNFVICNMSDDWEDFINVNFFVVQDVLGSLHKIGENHRLKFAIPIIAITGSNGKTTIKELIYKVLEDHYHIAKSPYSYNSQIGVPLSVCEIDEKSDIYIAEAGISEPNEMSRLERILKPNIGIISNINECHSENFESIEHKCNEKLSLFRGCKAIICSDDDKTINKELKRMGLESQKKTWSTNPDKECFLVVKSIQKTEYCTFLNYTVDDKNYTINIRTIDEIDIHNLLHVITFAHYYGLPTTKISDKLLALSHFSPSIEVREALNSCLLIIDNYQTDLYSLRIALNFQQQRVGNSSRNKTLILSSDNNVAVKDERKYLIQLFSVFQEKNVDKFIYISANKSSLECPSCDTIESHIFTNMAEFIESKVWNNFRNEVILLKDIDEGDNRILLDKLEGKKHQAIVKINLDTIVGNLRLYRKRLKPTTKIICMLKANGYGTGSLEIAKTLEYYKCDYLAVAVTEEGVLLRNEGIGLPVIVLNSEFSDFQELIRYNLEPEVYCFSQLEYFISKAEELNITNYPIHLKIDTGMHRLGFEEQDISRLVTIISNQKSFLVKSIFSHLVGSGNSTFDDFTLFQIERFKKIFHQLQASINYPIMKHILNSSGIERFNDEQMDMVRLGISLYGVNGKIEGLKPVTTLCSTILQVKSIRAGDTIGYDRKGRVAKDSNIATVRMGYADGVDRRFGNGRCKVIVNGNNVPTIGNICMDLMMIDITGFHAKEGDIVTIFSEKNPIESLAQDIDTIPYELLTSISGRVKHIYIKE